MISHSEVLGRAVLSFQIAFPVDNHDVAGVGFGAVVECSIVVIPPDDHAVASLVWPSVVIEKSKAHVNEILLILDCAVTLLICPLQPLNFLRCHPTVDSQGRVLLACANMEWGGFRSLTEMGGCV